MELEPADWSEYLEAEGLPPDFLKTADHAAFHVLVARDRGEIVSAALAYDLKTDCGIYNLGTAERARRRGLGAAVTAAQRSGPETSSRRVTRQRRAGRCSAPSGLPDS